MRDTFPRLQQGGTGLFKAKGSKFHGYAFPLPFHDEAAAEQAVDEHLQAVRKDTMPPGMSATRGNSALTATGPPMTANREAVREPPSTACSAPTTSTGPSLPSCGISAASSWAWED